MICELLVFSASLGQSEISGSCLAYTPIDFCFRSELVGVYVDFEAFKRHFEIIFEALLLSPSGTFSCTELTVHKLLLNTYIRHAHNMYGPS